MSPAVWETEIISGLYARLGYGTTFTFNGPHGMRKKQRNTSNSDHNKSSDFVD